MAEGVRAVGGDLDVENDVARRQHLMNRRAKRGPSVQDEQPAVFAAHTEFVRGAHHAVGQLPADARLLDGEIAREHRAGQGDGDTVAHPVVRRAADDGLDAAGGADVDRADGELVRVGMRVAGEHLTHHDTRQRRHAGARDLLDLEAEEGDRVDEILDRGVERDVGLEPVEGDFHEKFPPEISYANCRRNRRSFW